MKTMLWMRHGKSDWNAGYGADHERPLATRGVKAAKAMGAALERADLLPDFVLSSTAVRARTTAELALGAVRDARPGWDVTTRHERGLYDGGVARVLDLVRETPDEADRAVETLLVAGHEPTWSTAVSRLIGGGEVRMVTAAVACIVSDAERWRDVKADRCRLLWFLPPKLLAKLCRGRDGGRGGGRHEASAPASS